MNAGYANRGLRVGVVVAIAVVAGFAIWYFVIRDTGSTGPQPGSTGPVLSTEADIASLSKSLDQPVYWAGPQPGTKLELTDLSDGRIYVRYLKGNAQPGSPSLFLTVGTYPFNGAYHALKVVAKQPGATVKDVANGGIAVTNSDSPDSVYLAYPDQNFQVEVFDPNPAKALDLATSGAVSPIR